MGDVVMNMDVGNHAVKSEPTPGKRFRGLKLANPKTLAKLKVLDAKKYAAAQKRGAWKDASRKDRKIATSIAAEIRVVKFQAIAEHEAGKMRELDKQAAAAKREQKLRGSE